MKLTELYQIRENEERSVLSVMGKQKDAYLGMFMCDNIKLTSLVGSPSTLVGDFYCNENLLTSLRGAPSSIKGAFYCGYNRLASLNGSPTSVSGHYYCNQNEISSLNCNIEYVGGLFDCGNNKLTSLRDIHKHIKHIGGYACFKHNPIKSHILGLMLIDGLRHVNLDNRSINKIIDKHLKGDRDVFACQEELIEAGFEEYAQL